MRPSGLRLGKRWPAILPGALLALMLGLRIANPRLLEDAQLSVFDAFQRFAPRPYQAAPVRVVDIDDATLARLGQWPWPRTLVARLVERLTELRAGAIAFDIVFAEPDRTSPLNVVPLWPNTPELEAMRAKAQQLPDHDQVLARAIARAPVVTGFAFTSPGTGTTAGPSAGLRAPLRKAGFAYAGEDPRAYVPSLPGAVVNLAPLEEAAAGNGHFTLLAERDGMTRRVPFVLRFRDQLYPSLAAEALRVAQGASTHIIKSSAGSGERSWGGETGIVSIKTGSFVIPTDARGSVWVYYTNTAPGRTIPAWQVMTDGALPEDAVEGCIVFIGTSATGLKDLRATPVNPVAPGVEVHAQVVEQILTETFLRRPDWADGAETVYLLLLGLVLIALLPRAGAAACAWIGAGAIGLVCALSWVAFARWRWLLDPVGPSLAALAIYLVSSLTNFMRTEAERREVRQAFSRYLSPALVDRLAKHPEQLRLGGERKTMTILFADIRGFTAIAEQYNAEELARFMNQFLTPMTQAVLEFDGTVDKYVGDCIMAFWNAPLDDPEHARHGCLAALRMREHLVTLNQQLRAEWQGGGRPFRPIHIGVGLNTGECSVGNFGSDQRFDYSVLGDPVNLASRLEGQAGLYGVDVVVGEATAACVSDWAPLELDLITVVGKTSPSRIFGLLGEATLAADPQFQALRQRHEELLRAYRAKRWDEALALVEACLALDTARTRLRVLYALYRERVTAYQAHPPGEGWSGVFVATSK